MGKESSRTIITKDIMTVKVQSSVRAKLSPEALRTHCVSIRLNNAELSKLNTLRGYYAKGEWLRMAFLHKLPSIIPEINIEAWKALSEISQKLNRIAIHIDAKSKDSKLTHTELFAVKRQLEELRCNLLRADFWSVPREGNAEDTQR
jgi:hypothetical protein